MQAANTPTSNRITDRLTTQLPLMWFSLAFLAGIVLASLVSLSISVWVSLTVFAIWLLMFARVFGPRLPASFPLHPFAFILFTALCLGGMRYQMSVPRFNAFHIAFYNDRQYDLLITGTLSDAPDYRDDYTNL